MFFVFYIGLLFLLFAHGQQPSCDNIFRSFCIDQDEFHEWVAHGIHSMTLQELQFFFDASASTDNSIPRVNDDLSSSDLILPSIPDLMLNNSFLTPAMHSVDYILSNWERDNFIMHNSSVLELLVHNLHMYETMTVAGKMYRKIKRNLKQQMKKGKMKKVNEMKRLCECIKGKEDKIIEELVDTAKRFREINENKRAHWRNYYCWCRGYSLRSASGLPDHCPRAPTPQPSKEGKVQPLENSTIWGEWKAKLEISQNLLDRWNIDLAHYIYCKLNIDE